MCESPSATCSSSIRTGHCRCSLSTGCDWRPSSDETPEQAIGKLINYLPIFGFKGGAMTELDGLRRPRLGYGRSRCHRAREAVELAPCWSR